MHYGITSTKEKKYWINRTDLYQEFLSVTLYRTDIVLNFQVKVIFDQIQLQRTVEIYKKLMANIQYHFTN